MENKDITIVVDNVHKSFKTYKDRAFQLKDAVIFHNFNKPESREILRGISFNVGKGEAVALIGENGCGKSTTLKLLTRILSPDSGSVHIKGRSSSLIELGAGFHPDMSGRENIYINASIFGIAKKEVDKRIDDIITFSEIEDFIDDPVRTYSSGMYMRLAFSIAINVDAEVLLIDEILAVGDAAFQMKCFNKLQAMKNNGTTIVLVSHSMEQVKQLCDRAIWLEEGLIKEEGSPDEVCNHYLEAMNDARVVRDIYERRVSGEQEDEKAADEIILKNKSCRELTTQYNEEARREGTWDAKYTKITLCDENGNECNKFKTGDKIIVDMEYVNYEPEARHSFYVGITREDMVRANESSTKRECGDLLMVPEKGKVRFIVESNSLLVGKYTIGARIYGENSKMCDDITGLISFWISNVNEHEAGMFHMNHTWIVDGQEIKDRR